MRVEVTVIAGPAQGTHVTFENPDCFLFGRALDAWISLPGDPYVSRQHFLLEISPPDCKITDLNSKNGTYVNGIRYGGRKQVGADVRQAPDGSKETLLSDGDEINVGDTFMTVSINQSPQPSDKDQKNPRKPAQPPKAGKRKVRCIRCNQDVTQEAGTRGQMDGAEYVCNACRKEDSAGHIDVIQELLHDASDKKSLPGAPAIPGYRIEDVISQGGMGMIYKASNRETRLTVAVKTMLPHVAVDPESVKVFQREIDLTRQLHHPNVVRLIEHGKADGTFYFILEYVDGMDLGRLLDEKQGPVPLEEAAPIMVGALAGLEHAHRATITMQPDTGREQAFTGIVHRDLKPQNILLTFREHKWLAKVTDFGISKHFEAAGMTNMTSPGEVLGTPMYWPREQITHYRYLHPATDVFSIAAVFYEMLTRDWVRNGFTELFTECQERKRYPGIADYMTVISGNHTIPIRERNPAIPKPVALVLDRALQEMEVPRDKKKMRRMIAELRYPDAGAFRDALEYALQETGFSESQYAFQGPPGKEDVISLKEYGIEIDLSSSSHVQPPPPEEEDDESFLRGEIVYTIAARQVPQQEVALFVLDLAHSTEFVLDVGDTYFSTLMGQIHKLANRHSSTSELLFMKNTGDGFIAVFQTMQAAFSLAMTFLETYMYQDIHLRIALHWGAVKTGPGGDVLGREVHRVCRIEGITADDQISKPEDAVFLPLSDRVIITREGLQQLDPATRAQFKSAGRYRLKGFSDPHDVWIFHKSEVLDMYRV